MRECVREGQNSGRMIDEERERGLKKEDTARRVMLKRDTRGG